MEFPISAFTELERCPTRPAVVRCVVVEVFNVLFHLLPSMQYLCSAPLGIWVIGGGGVYMCSSIYNLYKNLVFVQLTYTIYNGNNPTCHFAFWALFCVRWKLLGWTQFIERSVIRVRNVSLIMWINGAFWLVHTPSCDCDVWFCLGKHASK